MKLTLKSFVIVCLLLKCLCVGAVGERTFQAINASNDLADNSAQIVVCTKTGRMIISTLGNLNFYDGASFSIIGTRQDYQYQLPRYKGNYHLYFDRRHHIWLKNTHSMTCVDLLNEKFVLNVDSVIREMGCLEPVQDLFVDSVGSVWMLTEKGLYGIDNQKTYHVLKDLNLQDVDVFDNLLLTFYDDGEEVAQDISTGSVVHRSKAYDWDTAQRYNLSSVILRYKDSYFQLRNGAKESVLLRFDVKEQRWTTIKQFDYHANNLALHHERLYIPTEWGFWIYYIKDDQMEWVKQLTLNDGNVIETDCNMLAFDRQDGLWIGTENRGVLYARPTKPVFKSYPWSDPLAMHYYSKMDGLEQNITEFHGLRANCMYMDSRGWSWIGTTTGLYLYRSPHSEPVIFTKQRGLYNNVIHSVVEDRQHNIWVATSNGISFIRFDGDEVVFVNSFNQVDGVPSESFGNCKAMLLDDGRIVMKGIDHVVVFNPDDLEELNTPHPYKLFPKMVRLMVNGNFVQPGASVDDNVIIDRAITRIKDISLNSDQNTVSLTFSALNYYRPLQTYYRVRIKGISEYDDWQVFSFFDAGGKVDSKGMLHLPLIGLEPGTYELEVQASMYPDQWDGFPFVWNVHVNESWWRTTGMRWLIGFFVFVLAVVNLVIYLRNERMRMRRNHGEGDMIRKIRQFVERCDSFSSEALSPSQDDYAGGDDDASKKLSPAFIELMIKLMPYVRNHMKGELTMSQLGNEAGMDVVTLYELMMADIYKSPNDLARIYRVQRAADLLRTTDKTIEEIAVECGFYTPNYFMGNFFHQFKQTPREYREFNVGK